MTSEESVNSAAENWAEAWLATSLYKELSKKEIRTPAEQLMLQVVTNKIQKMIDQKKG